MTRFSSSSPPRTPAGRVIKVIAMVALFASIVILFWKHFERSMVQISGRSGSGETKIAFVSDERWKTVQDAARRIEEQFGAEVKVSVSSGELLIPETGGNTIFFGILPKRRISVVILPPLVERSVGEEFASYLKHEHFEKYWEMPNGWEQGLEDGLILLWNALRQTEKEQ